VGGPSRGGSGPPKRGRRPCQGAPSEISQSVNAATDNHDAQQPQQKIFSPPDTPLAVLRAENALLIRLNRRLRQVLDDLGGRTLLDLAIECAGLRGDLATLDALAGFYLARARPHLLRAIGGDQFVPEFAIDIAPGTPRS
jgi:hypothetical protein